jgi:ATP-dependent Clp protease ATP-binding subunit ClpB
MGFTLQVLTVMLQMLDDGRLTDSKGRVVDFSNTIIILTSNLGAQYLLREAEKAQAAEEAVRAAKRGRTGSANATTTDSGSDVDMIMRGLRPDGTKPFVDAVPTYGISPETEARVMAAVRDHFLPEFLNRLDEIVIFKPLGPSELRTIVAHQVADMATRLADQDISITCTSAALDEVLRDSYNPAYGARPMRRYIEKHIATELSRLIIAGRLADHSIVQVDAPAAGTTGSKFVFHVDKKMVVS